MSRSGLKEEKNVSNCGLSQQTHKEATTVLVEFTDDGVLLEKDVVAFTAANPEDQLTDVEQVVSADSQLQGKCKRKSSSSFYI